MSPPAHYALTEILIILSSIYAILIFKERKNYFAIVGIALIGLAATIGAVRFGLSSNTLIVQLNKITGIYAGLICIGLVSIQMAYNLGWKVIYKILMCAILMSLLAGYLFPKLIMFILILAWSVISILIAMDYPEKIVIKRIFRGFLMSILLIGFLTARKNGILANYFGPSISFHIYHIIIAVWIYSTLYLTKKPMN
tara:strand:- start:639 stop:1229 length:591 start_codon:yes stop_codon:yes gene_type:complete